jgi:hypothetical protein
MSQPIDPADYNLSGRTVLERVGPKHIAIVIHRKSRPVCGKTRQFLQEHDIDVI